MIHTNENVKRWGPLGRFFRVVYNLVLRPGTFYEQLPSESRYLSAMAFLLTCSLLSSVVGSLSFGEKRVVLAFIYFLNAFFMPFFTALLLYVVTLLLCKSVFSYQRLFVITAYANVTLLITWIPGLSWITGIWKFYLIGLGMVKIGRIKGSKAFIVLVATAGILVLLIQLLIPIFKQG